MKRADLEAKLQGIENAKEIIDFVMSENGKEIETLKATHKAELAKYDGIDLAKAEEFKKFDPKILTEVEELRKYKTDTETAQVRAKKESAVLELLKSNKASEKASKLLIRGIDLNAVELDESGAIKDGEKIIEPLKKDFAEYFTTETNGGAQAGNPPGATTQKPETLASAVAEKMGNFK